MEQPSGASREPVGAAAVGQIDACAILFCAGATAAISQQIRELSFHTAEPRSALLFGSAAACVGMAFGLWAPRRFLLHRLLARSTAKAPTDGRSIPQRAAAPDSVFAASVAGTLFLAAAGATWVLLMVGAAAESGRELITYWFVLPGGLVRNLIVVPLLVGHVLIAACMATAMAALHGWHRMTGGSATRLERLWILMFAASAGGAAASTWLSDGVGMRTLVLLPMILAGLTACLRRSARRVEEAVPLTAPSAEGAPLTPVITAVCAAGLAGGALGAMLSHETSRPLLAGLYLAPIGAGAAIGIFLGLALLRSALGARITPTLLVLCAGVLCGFPYEYLFNPATAAAVRLGVAVITATAALAVSARRIAAHCAGVQHALSVVGVCTATGLAIGLLATPLWMSAASPPIVALALSVVVTALAGVMTLLDRAQPLRIGIISLAPALLGLAMLPAVSRLGDSMTDDAAAADIAPAAISVRDRLKAGGLDSSGFRVALVNPGISTDPSGVADGWRIDVQHPRNDLVVIAAADSDPRRSPSGSGARRFVRRSMNALLVGGRLVIELPSDELVLAAFHNYRKQYDAFAWRAYHLRAKTAGGREYAALIFGPDVPGWVARRLRPSNVQISLHRVRNLAEVRALTAGREVVRTARTDGGH